MSTGLGMRLFVLLALTALAAPARAQLVGPLGPGAASNVTVGTSVITGGTSGRVLYDNAGVLGEYTISGTGGVAMTTSPTFAGTLTAISMVANNLTLVTGGSLDGPSIWNSGGTTFLLSTGTSGLTINDKTNANNLITVSNAGLVALLKITTDATHTDSTVCQDTTTHALYAGSGTAGICLGTSSARFKNSIVEARDGLSAILALRPVNFFYNEGAGDNGAREQYGFLAEDVMSVLPKLTHLDARGEPQSVDLLGMVPVLVKAMQEQEKRLAALENRGNGAD